MTLVEPSKAQALATIAVTDIMADGLMIATSLMTATKGEDIKGVMGGDTLVKVNRILHREIGEAMVEIDSSVGKVAASGEGNGDQNTANMKTFKP